MSIRIFRLLVRLGIAAVCLAACSAGTEPADEDLVLPDGMVGRYEGTIGARRLYFALDRDGIASCPDVRIIGLAGCLAERPNDVTVAIMGNAIDVVGGEYTIEFVATNGQTLSGALRPIAGGAIASGIARDGATWSATHKVSP